jgi:hypothetical protein
MRSLTRLLILFCLISASGFAGTEFDDCDANFIAFIGSSTYRFSPHLEGELGSVRLFGHISYHRAAHEGRSGIVPWRLRIESVDRNEIVLELAGRGTIDQAGSLLAEYWWDGKDANGAVVPEGRYRYTFNARFIERSAAPRVNEIDYASLPANLGEEATAGSDEVFVDPNLTKEASQRMRLSANAATSCQVQQNLPLEAGFGYNFYYGSTHAHSNWSDGGYPTSGCSSGNAYGSGTSDPGAVFAFARDTAGLDFWVVNEHNHLMEDAIRNNAAPLTEAKLSQRYQAGITAANNATTSTFVGMYGMEWGVSTNTDQGHVTLIETPKLFGWETCTTCNGPNPECTPGTDCYFDVFTPKRYGYLTMYKRSVENPSVAGALGIFNHPSTGNFDNFAFNADADAAIQGIAVRSGLAFSTATDCATANVGSTDYSVRWREALSKGFHLAPVADHDSHCNNYGIALPTRTVYLLPNGTAPVLTKTRILEAHKSRRFYATEDPNLQLVFRTSDSSRVMGDIFNAAGGATLVAKVLDPENEAVTTIELWRGQIGTAAPTAPYQTFSNVNTISVTENLTSGSYWYFIRAIQADGHDAWSAPMWITYQAGGDTTAPSTSITAPAAGATVSGTTTVSASASDNVGVTKVEFHLDGVLQSTDTAAPYEWSWNTTTSTNASHTLQSKAFDAAGNVGTSASVSVTVNNAAAGDTTAPTTSITAPAAGATVSGTTAVTASASDAVGVTKVEFYLNGALQSTDTASPYEWSWNTTTAANGSHTLASKAYDAAGNVGSSANVSVTVSNATGVSIAGWTLTQANASLTYTIPAGVTIPSLGYVVIARNADKAAFEAFWGRTLGTNVVFINSVDSMPQINGSETYSLSNASGTRIDGVTVAMGSSGGEALQRKNGCGAANKAASWNRVASSSGNPGSGAPAPCGKGTYISEFSDALGTGNFVYEFIELHNDK